MSKDIGNDKAIEGQNVRATRSQTRRLSTEQVDTPPEVPTSKGRRSIRAPSLRTIIETGSKNTNAGSSDDGSNNTPSPSGTSVVGEGTATTSVRMTRARRSSLLTEENVATLSPVRRSRRRSHLSDDVSNISSAHPVQKSTPVQRGTPVQKGTPSVEETASNKIITRNVSVLLTSCTPMITENKKEAVVKADANTVEQITKDPVKTTTEVPAPIEISALNTPQNPNVSSSVGVENVTDSIENVWAPRPTSNDVNLDKTEYMDVDVIDISSSSEDCPSKSVSENLLKSVESNKVPVGGEATASIQLNSSLEYSEVCEIDSKDSQAADQYEATVLDKNLDDIIVEATSKSKSDVPSSHEEKSDAATPKEANVKLPAAVPSATPKRKKSSSVSQAEIKLLKEPTTDPIQTPDSVKFSQMSNTLQDDTPDTPSVIPTSEESMIKIIQINEDSVQMESSEIAELVTLYESLDRTVIAANTDGVSLHDRESEPSNPTEEIIVYSKELTTKENSVTPKPIKSSSLSHAEVELLNEPPIEASKTPDTMKFQKAEEATPCSPAAMPPPKGSKRRTVQFDKGSTPVQAKPSENEKHVDTPYPIKRVSTSEKSLNLSDNDGEPLQLSQKSLNFDNSWNHSVKGSVNTSIDQLGVDAATETVSVAEIEVHPLMKDKAQIEEDDEAEMEEIAEEKRYFLDNEAIEASDDDDSLDEETRREMEENEIKDIGEDLGSEDTSESDCEEAYEKDSFIASEDDVAAANSDLEDCMDAKQTEKKYRRVIALADDSSDDEQPGENDQLEHNVQDTDPVNDFISSLNETTKDDNDNQNSELGEIDVPIAERIKKMKLRKSLLVPEGTKTSVETLDRSLPLTKNKKRKSISDNGSDLSDAPISLRLSNDNKQKSVEKKPIQITELSENENSPNVSNSDISMDTEAVVSEWKETSGDGNDQTEISEMEETNQALKKLISLKSRQSLPARSEFVEEKLNDANKSLSAVSNIKTPIKSFRKFCSPNKTTPFIVEDKDQIDSETNTIIDNNISLNNLSGFVEEDMDGNTASANDEENNLPSDCSVGDGEYQKGLLNKSLLNKSLRTPKASERNAASPNKRSAVKDNSGTPKSFIETTNDVHENLQQSEADSSKEWTVLETNKLEVSQKVASNFAFTKHHAEVQSSTPKTNRAGIKNNTPTEAVPIESNSETDDYTNINKSSPEGSANISTNTILAQCKTVLNSVNETRELLRKGCENSNSEEINEKSLKKKEKKERKLELRAEREKRIQQAAEAEKLKKKERLQKKRVGTQLDNESGNLDSASDSTTGSTLLQKRKHSDSEIPHRNMSPTVMDTTIKEQVVTNENVTPPRADQSGSNKRKYLKILKKGNTFKEEPITPPRIISGFRESPLTPISKHFKVEDITPVVRQKKRRQEEYPEPTNVLAKPKWITRLDGGNTNAKRAKLSQNVQHSIGSTEFHVRPLSKKNRIRACDLLPKELINFRKKIMYGSNVPRVDSTTLSRQKNIKLFNN